MNTSMCRFGLAALATLALSVGCDDDKIAAPKGNSGVTVFQLGVGQYEVIFEAWVCGETDTMSATFPISLCETMGPGDDGYDDISICETTYVDGNQLKANCDWLWSPMEGCTLTYEADFNGTQTALGFTVEGSIVLQETTPPGCYNPVACTMYRLTGTKTGARPEFCDYGEINQIDMDVTGAPFSHVILASESWSNFDGVGHYYSVFATSSAYHEPGNPSGVVFQFRTPSIDPAHLPKVVDVTLEPPVVPPRVAPPPTTVEASYSEWSSSGEIQQLFVPETATGTMTIVAISDEFMAGSFDIDWTGTYMGNPASRTTTGSFNVENMGPIGPAPGSASREAATSGLSERLMRMLLRDANAR